MNPSLKLSVLSLLVSSLVACGQADAPKEAESSSEEKQAAAAPAPAPAPAAQPAAAERSAPAVEDIERWQRGMAAEKKLVQEAAAKLAAAKDEGAKLEALNVATEMGTLDAGASAAGLDRDAYRRIRSTFSGAVSQLSPIEMEMDVSKMPPELVTQMQQGREAGAEQLARQLPAEVFAALKARAGELRQQDKELVAERLKVAQAAR